MVLKSSEDLIPIEPVDPLHSDVGELLQLSDQYLTERYPPDVCYLETADDLQHPHTTLLGAIQANRIVAMGALKLHQTDGGYGEIKRLFVHPEWRNRGIADQLLIALEQQAHRQQLPLIRLEAGTRQPEALRLYQKHNYRQRGPFGEYPDSLYSVFMEKSVGDIQ